MRPKLTYLLCAACLSILALLPNVKMNASQSFSLSVPASSDHPDALDLGPRAASLKTQILSLLALPRTDLSRADAEIIARAVTNEGERNHIDPVMLLAVIKTESQFRSDVVGLRGELGLMQILPATAVWMARRIGLPAHFNLRDPATNIRIGAAYLAHLRTVFRKVSVRYVGAYNMGAANVRRLIAGDSEPTVYPAKVLKHYRNFRLSYNPL